MSARPGTGPGAEAAVARATAGLLVTELLAAGWPAADRVTAVTRVLAELCRLTRPEAVYWARSQRVSDPQTLAVTPSTGSSTSASSPWPATSRPWCWTRSDCTSSGCPTCSATSGAGSRGRSPGLLYATARYVFDSGDVIADGHTISGLEVRSVMSAGGRPRCWSRLGRCSTSTWGTRTPPVCGTDSRERSTQVVPSGHGHDIATDR